MTNESEDSLIEELISDFFGKVFQYNHKVKQLLNPILIFVEEYMRIYLYLIYSLIILLLLVSVFSLSFTVRSYIILSKLETLLPHLKVNLT